MASRTDTETLPVVEEGSAVVEVTGPIEVSEALRDKRDATSAEIQGVVSLPEDDDTEERLQTHSAWEVWREQLP